MKKWSMFLAAAACACVLASPLQAAERKKVNISFPTAATTGALYPLGAGIANLWNTKLGYVNARVQASNGGIQNLTNSYQKDFDKSWNRDSNYIYGPSLPRSYYAGVKVVY